MAYQLEAGEGIAPGVLRIAREELDGAIAQLREGVAQDPVKGVHEARKSLKKERALVRLLRGALPRETRRAEITRLGEAGRRLSDLRDAQVALQTVDDLAARYPGRLSKAAFGRVRRALRAAGTARGLPALRATAAAVAAELEAARDGVDDWAGVARGWEDLEPGLARTYADGHAGLAAARARPGDEELHEWRKRVKDLWYHQRVLQPLWAPVIGAQVDVLDELGQLLGDDQDLANLHRTLSELDEAQSAPAADLEPLLELIEGRRLELRAAALRLGARVYAERPKAFLRRHRAYAGAWEAAEEVSTSPVPG